MYVCIFNIAANVLVVYEQYVNTHARAHARISMRNAPWLCRSVRMYVSMCVRGKPHHIVCIYTDDTLVSTTQMLQLKHANLHMYVCIQK